MTDVMGGNVTLGRYAGIPIRAHWSVLVIVSLLTFLLAEDILPATVPGATVWAYWLTALTLAVLLIACLLVHELAHAVRARRLGVRVKSITLWVLGGVAAFTDEPRTPKSSATIAAAGPVASIVLSGVFLLAASLTSPIWLGGLPITGLSWLAVANSMIGAFNLLPAAPLDGGRLLHAWLWRRSGDKEQATVHATAVGQFFGYLLVGLGVATLLTGDALGGVWLAVLGWFVTTAAIVERVQAQVFAKLDGVRVRDVMTPDPVFAPGWWTIEAFADHVVAARVRHRVFPVLNFDGKPVGVVSLRELADARTATRLQDTARPLTPHSAVRPGEPLTDVLRRAAPRSDGDALVVVENHVLVGILTATDITRTLELTGLRRGPVNAAGPARA